MTTTSEHTLHEEQVTLTLQVPDGYEAINELRIPVEGEHYLSPNGQLGRAQEGRSTAYIILRALPSLTVTVELPRETVELGATGVPPWTDSAQLACLAALAAEKQS